MRAHRLPLSTHYCEEFSGHSVPCSTIIQDLLYSEIPDPAVSVWEGLCVGTAMIKLSLKWKNNQYYQRFRHITTSNCMFGGTRNFSLTFALPKQKEIHQLWYILNARNERSSLLIKFHRFLGEKNTRGKVKQYGKRKMGD